MKNNFNLGNVLVIGITIIVFAIALVVKGFTHDLLLEVGVLLVSIKIIMMNNKISMTNQVIIDKMNEMKKAIDELKSANSNLHSD